MEEKKCFSVITTYRPSLIDKAPPSCGKQSQSNGESSPIEKWWAQLPFLQAQDGSLLSVGVNEDGLKGTRLHRLFSLVRYREFVAKQTSQITSTQTHKQEDCCKQNLHNIIACAIRKRRQRGQMPGKK